MIAFSKRDKNSILLLRFALEKEGVTQNSYYIGDMGDEKRLDDKLCLLKQDGGKWGVLYTERGNISQLSEHSSLNDAARDFFGRLTSAKTHWAYREDWEKETGLIF